MTAAMMAAIGMVSDGGDALAAKGQAVADAYGAARAGAQAIDQASFARGGTPTPDAGAAVVAARRYLSQAGVSPGEALISINGAEVTVSVTLSAPVPILAAIGAQPFHVTGQGRARAVYGVRGPEA